MFKIIYRLSVLIKFNILERDFEYGIIHLLKYNLCLSFVDRPFKKNIYVNTFWTGIFLFFF